ncbi:FAD-dependent oxidoreductase [soil metagenome]
MASGTRFERRNMLKGSLAVGGMLGLQACTTSGAGRIASASTAGTRSPLMPMRVSPDQLIDIKCCLRPLRAAGPNLSTEQIGDTLVIHNYGHGGSGWSLSWGSGEVAVGKALSVLPKEIAVIGCGIIGLTAAVVAQRAGMKVTIYARDMIPRTRSFRASGSFTPDSRIALAEPAGAAFGDTWETMARLSWKTFRTYLGLPGTPVEFIDSYTVSDTPITRRLHPADPAITDSWATKGLPQQNSEFASYGSRIRDIVPQAVPVAVEDSPFAMPYTTRTSIMHFNFAAYGHMLMTEFFERGGKFEMREFHSPGEVTTLKEKVVIHSTGFAARDLWKDRTVMPVRGQTGWLVPQPDAHYGLRYGTVSIQGKSDGMVIMNNSPDLGEMLGVGDSNELPAREPIEEAMRILAPIFAAMPGRRV